MVYCTAFNCKHDGKSSVSFFQFPTNEKYRKIWVEKVRRIDWEPTEHSRLCSAHFESHCFAQKLKLLESLGLPRPKKLILKHDAIPTIFDYEDRSSKKSAAILSRKRKSVPKPQTGKPKSRRQRKIIEVIDFASLLDEYLKGLESEEKQPPRRGSNQLVDEMIPESGLCEGGDKFVLFLNKQLPEAARSLPLVVRFGSANVVPVTLWKDFIIRGESIPKSDIPGSVFIQLETNEGLVLGSTTFMYKEEITTGFRKIVISKNYGEQLLDAFSQTGGGTTSDDTVGTFMSDSAIKTEIPPDETSSSHSSLISVLRLMLYIAAKNKATGFVQTIFKTNIGKKVLSSFCNRQQPTNYALEFALQKDLAFYIEDVFNRLIIEEQKAKDEIKEKCVKRSKMREPEKVCKCGENSNEDSSKIQRGLKREETPTKTVKRVRKKIKLSPLSKKPESPNEVPAVYSGTTSKTNYLLLLSDIALRHQNSATDMNSLEDSYSSGFSLSIPSAAAVAEKEKYSPQKRNTRSFSRKVLLLPNGSTRLPPQFQLSRLRKNPETCGNLQLGINMTASEILLEAREMFKHIRKRRVRLAAADSSGQLDFFKSSKWTAKTLRQRIRSSSVLYVVPSK